MVKKEITTCEKELAKIKIKAEKRHQTYLKNKKPKGPSKNDVIKALMAEVEQLKQHIKEVVVDEITPLLDEIITTIETEEEGAILDEITPLLDEIITKIETEETTPSLDEITPLLDEIITKIEVKEEGAILDEITPLLAEIITQIEDRSVEEKIYDTNYIKDDNFNDERPLFTSKCQYKESIYTLDFMIEQINELSWKSDAIRDIVSYSVNVMYPLMENPYLPTCIVCLEKLVINLDYVETENRKKKIYFQCLMVLIRRLEIDLKPNVIKKYTKIYTSYSD